jgi:hypothetical protein
MNNDDVVRVQVPGDFVYDIPLENGGGHGQTPLQSALFYIK